jgi:hypothetical protein
MVALLGQEPPPGRELPCLGDYLRDLAAKPAWIFSAIKAPDGNTRNHPRHRTTHASGFKAWMRLPLGQTGARGIPDGMEVG